MRKVAIGMKNTGILTIAKCPKYIERTHSFERVYYSNTDPGVTITGYEANLTGHHPSGVTPTVTCIIKSRDHRPAKTAPSRTAAPSRTRAPSRTTAPPLDESTVPDDSTAPGREHRPGRQHRPWTRAPSRTTAPSLDDRNSGDTQIVYIDLTTSLMDCCVQLQSSTSLVHLVFNPRYPFQSLVHLVFNPRYPFQKVYSLLS
ncbi:hypothetical protein M011DRAFT_45350 [Sporormia fimetaria CBS 119925]|uniref:Uncharacterized protein n=1 Tax=Sporormia fimetaria CBS 119925 TaxID=1340428 RepID=A0A6A6VCP9_9PLEO|nr:hypothetical protein M011DRAFT_45350 [Sporormia fimetaria CBS 119925]